MLVLEQASPLAWWSQVFPWVQVSVVQAYKPLVVWTTYLVVFFVKHGYGVVAVWNGSVDACYGRGSWPRWSNCANSFRTILREHWSKRHGELKEWRFMERMIAKCCTQSCAMAWPHLQGLVCNNPTYFYEVFFCVILGCTIPFFKEFVSVIIFYSKEWCFWFA
jgi:hypothetical protein